MNIKGLELLKEKGLNVKFFFFNDFEDAKSFLEKDNSGKRFILKGFDLRTSVNDHPYKIKKFRRFSISKEEVCDSFSNLREEMLDDEVPKDKIRFALGHCFDNQNTLFEGQVFRVDNFVHFDFCEGSRKSGRDMKPCASFSIPIINNKYIFRDKEDYGMYWNTIFQICSDLRNFEIGNPYLDFSVSIDKELIYYDLSLH